MITLTNTNVHQWKLNRSVLSRLIRDIDESKHNKTKVFTLFILAIGTLVAAYLFDNPLTLVLAVSVGVSGLLWLIGKIDDAAYEMRWESINTYLFGQPIENVIQQAISLGPGRLGRSLLFKHLDRRDAHWRQQYLDALMKLERSEEISHDQRSDVTNYLNENQPGWSGVGLPDQAFPLNAR